MSASCNSHRSYPGMSYCRGNIIERKSEAVMRTHSWARVAPSGWKSVKPGMIRSGMAAMASASAMRGSVVYVAVSGGGTGWSTSHVRGARFDGSWARRS